MIAGHYHCPSDHHHHSTDIAAAAGDYSTLQYDYCDDYDCTGPQEVVAVLVVLVVSTR